AKTYVKHAVRPECDASAVVAEAGLGNLQNDLLGLGIGDVGIVGHGKARNHSSEQGRLVVADIRRAVSDEEAPVLSESRVERKAQQAVLRAAEHLLADVKKRVRQQFAAFNHSNLTELRGDKQSPRS